ncbi:ABC transporter permease subunit [Aurantimonas sp. C2-6-R+9]|uniref:ABC transporter permease n=1 Tax=unclassified Aurantimonas TaxID=2638230 RepID=UPI002E17A6CE|nr:MULTISPECIES: ABC transporter permease subunit [unclassified Aurantimonas]MEC5291138.1 ABC transporter permease subunit [Aurantimonas sp. C2-3-R2]MEC5381465.1 ABC transporter permease subunit [Aurantimonas sp. C2-6-R+9]MEC5411900.1 ABC transporter permease subunit [Aurantimonas sp. C2-4-R8]
MSNRETTAASPPTDKASPIGRSTEPGLIRGLIRSLQIKPRSQDRAPAGFAPATDLARVPILLQFAIIIAAGIALAAVWDGALRWPADYVIPMQRWITEFFEWLGKDAAIGPLKFRDVTRLIAGILEQPLDWAEYLLYRGVRSLGLPPIPWLTLVLGVAILAHWIGGWRLALFAALALLYLALFGLWRDSMRTLSLVVVSVPFAVAIGLWLGIWVTRSRRAAGIITPMFDLMQATPHMAYLVPVVVLFGFGQVPAMIATVIFAMPPMARCTILAVQTVPREIIESGQMSGCTPRQLLWKVQIPAGKRILMLGVNQVVMQTLAMVVVTFALAALFKEAAVLPKRWTVTFGTQLDEAVRWFSANAYAYIAPVRDFITVSMLIPLRDFFLAIPWPIVMAMVGAAGLRLGGARTALLCMGLVLAIVLFGFWVPAVLTVYLVFSAVVICVLIGVPVGIWAARVPRVARATMVICDTLQTFPSFIYLIPVIMLLKVGDLSNIVAILAYATVPAIRYTYLGLKRIPEVTIEAAIANGASPRQRLLKVELPIALPEIMLGLNQTIMMALAMVAITALIGSRDLGQEIYRALPTADTGRGILAGLGIAAIGIIADRLIQAWAERRKKQLGYV